MDLDNTLIAWNNPDGTPEMRQWLHDLRDGGSGLSWCLIIVPNGSSVRLRNLILTMKLGRSSPLLLGLIGLSNVSTMKNEVVMVGDQLMTDIRAAHRAGIRSILVKPLVEHDSIKTQINRARERRVMKQMAEKYGPIVYKKEFKNGRIILYWLWSPIQTENKRG